MTLKQATGRANGLSKRTGKRWYVTAIYTLKGTDYRIEFFDCEACNIFAIYITI